MSNAARVELPARWLTPQLFETVVARHRFAEHLAAGGDVSFEFPARAALPAQLGLWLLSFLNQLASIGGGRIRLEFAAPDGLFGYLDRNGFLQLLAPGIETVPSRPQVSGADQRRGQAVGLVEIAPLIPGTSGHDRQAIVGQLVDALIGFYPAGDRTERLKKHVFTVLGELVDNVFSHSRTHLPGYASLQAYDKMRRPRVQVAVSDSGLGIPASLRETLGQRIKGRTDAELVISAFREGLSRHGQNSGRGCGLLQCARLAADYGSTVYVRTPSAQVILRPASTDGRFLRADVRDDVGEFKGTHVCLEFRVESS
jgi:anti-sigma regulatory factor (Ser/Thr protein kinase)